MGKRVGQIAKAPEVKKSSSNSRVRKTERLQSMDTPVDRILFLQRTAGNQAVSRLMKSGALQAKLRIGQPGDKYEQEADRVADAVMRMPEPGVQRQVELEEEEETLQAKPVAEEITPLVQMQVEPEEEEEELQAKATSGHISESNPNLESNIQSLKGGGKPLPESDRAYFEPRFGRDFSQVWVHTDSRAAESARTLNARAFTVGKDMFFGTGQYSPEKAVRTKLLAHELSHVVQQTGARKLAPDFGRTERRRYTKGTVSPRTNNTHYIQRQEAETVKATSPIDKQIDCYVFIYETSDIRFKSVWKATAEFFARSHDGIAVEGGSSTAETMKNIIQAYDTKKYRCIKAIEFMGHGNPGSALSGKFSAKDFESDRKLRGERAKKQAEKKSGSKLDIVKNTELHTQFTAVKKLLCSASYFHFRTCETLKDPVKKVTAPAGEAGKAPATGAEALKALEHALPGKEEAFGRFLATEFGTHVIGHSKIVDTLLPGRRVFEPGGAEKSVVPESLIPPRTQVSKLEFRNFLLIIRVKDLEMEFPILGKRKITTNLYIIIEVLPDPENAEQYILRLQVRKPELFSLPEILPKILPQIPKHSISPTVKSIKENISGAGETPIKVPIDRRLIERFTKSNPKLSFTIPIKGDAIGGKSNYISIELKGIPKPQTWLEKRGGLSLGVDLALSSAADKDLIFLARPFLRVPLYDYRSQGRVGVELGLSLGSETIIGEIGVPLQLHSGRLLDVLFSGWSPDVDPYLSLTPFIGAGKYRSEKGVSGGLGVGLGVVLDSDIDIAIRGRYSGTPAGKTKDLMLRIGWVF